MVKCEVAPNAVSETLVDPDVKKTEQNQSHQGGSVRHAEKRRTGSCQFADRVAQVSVDKYREVVPLKWRQENQQVCLSTIVAHFKTSPGQKSRPDSTVDKVNGEDENETTTIQGPENDLLIVMGLGVGTKFLSEEKIRSDAESGIKGRTDDCVPCTTSYGKIIRDSHAEVLARRAFRRALTVEIKSLQLSASSRSENNNPDEEGDDPSSRTDGFGILRQIKRDTEPMKGPSSCTYALKEGVTLHMYTSSTPCGNSSLKKFSKMKREKFDSSIPPDNWPRKPHPCFDAHSLQLGQCALLVKKNGTTTGPGVENDSGGDETHAIDASHIVKKEKKWPANLTDDWCPPGTTLPHFGLGSLHSCSDKICRWNCLGLQGSLLSSLLETPLYMDTLTVGRKFTSCISQRAVCCRADGYCKDGNNTEANGNMNDDNEMQNLSYRLNHPSIMGTGVYLDDTGTLDMSNSKAVGQDVRFLSKLCWAWWSERSIIESNTDKMESAECIDGEEGLLFSYNQMENLAQVPWEENKMNKYSLISTYALSNSFLELVNEEIPKNDVEGNKTKMSESSTLKLALPELRDLKRRLSLKYESAKDCLVHKHKVFYQWNRRCP